ncbi:hypothetical protein [Chamaesiphon sp. OTE_75_metabat_556]|uniref:hypothetical protein n=1 Tax=Chamaesiphon sp. OTE_75_metabat_556 TaxID=2964692 RepID=UPI00286C1DC4|nr:hypothetical protein [Chamaesiphon sp. OTE_75_metabat_556]
MSLAANFKDENRVKYVGDRVGVAVNSGKTLTQIADLAISIFPGSGTCPRQAKCQQSLQYQRSLAIDTQVR